MRSLNQLRRLRHLLVGVKKAWLTRFWKMDIHPSVDMSLSAAFDKTHPAGIHVGADSYVAFDARLLAHDMTRNVKLHTRIGQRCFIGGRALVLPGVEIGDDCIVGSFFNQPDVRIIFWVLSPYVFLSVLNTQYIALLRRRMQIKLLETCIFYATLIASCAAIAVAWMGYGVTGLIVQLWRNRL